MVLFGEVLDVTKFIPIHPGGPSDIRMVGGLPFLKLTKVMAGQPAPL